jgi:hypothetical protein
MGESRERQEGICRKERKKTKKGYAVAWPSYLFAFFRFFRLQGSFCSLRNACGNLKNRREILELLQTLCTCPVATHEEVLSFSEANHLMGHGPGYIDIHLLASAKLRGIPFWTLDRPLLTAASGLTVAYGGR